MPHPYKKIKSHRFYGRTFQMRWQRPPIKQGKKHEGYVNQNRGFVYIYPNKNRQEFMDTIIHESMHVLSPLYSEECVELIALDLGELLWKVGFRYVPDIHGDLQKHLKKAKI